MRVSVFTPTYNRSETLPVLYSSLKVQTFSDFEWILVNDGSTDETDALVQSWKDEGIITIRYLVQENNGKHIAMNRALEIAKGYFFTTVDSDDILLPNGLEVLVNAWESIPKDEWRKYISIKAACIDLTTGENLGPSFRSGKLVCNYLDARYKKHINYEMQSLTRTEALREYPNPEIKGGLRFYPETIWQDLAAKKYLTIFINEPTYAYRTNSSESLLGRRRKYNRYRENIYLWAHIINDNFNYFLYNPGEFIKAFVGVSMDGTFNHMELRQILSMINGLFKKLLVVLFYPIGILCYHIKK